MQVVRTIIWVLILVGVVLFSFFNWRDVEVMIWDNLVLETKVPALVIISFLLGFLPTWLYARGVIWSLNRKIRSLEIAAKASSVSAAARESDREEAERTEPVEPEPESAPESHEETTAGAPAPPPCPDSAVSRGALVSRYRSSASRCLGASTRCAITSRCCCSVSGQSVNR